MTLSSGAVLWCLLVAPAQATDEPSNPGETKELKAARLAHLKKAAKGYDLTLASNPSGKLTLIPEPVLRFDDPVTGVVDAGVFVWSLDGRPTATASIWIQKSRLEYHEFQSLAEEGLVAANRGKVKWSLEQAGLERNAVAGAKPPAKTPAARLRQMRNFARRHQAKVIGPSGDEQGLRLLPRPVYRYGEADGPVTDGAMFAYCKGTNPEVVLLVEAVNNAGRSKWEYAFARMTSRRCEVRRGDELFWNAPLLRRTTPTDPYRNVVLRYAGPGTVRNDVIP